MFYSSFVRHLLSMSLVIDSESDCSTSVSRHRFARSDEPSEICLTQTVHISYFQENVDTTRMFHQSEIFYDERV